MKLALSMLTFFICLQLGYCQSDSNKIFTAATLKKGIYKNYQEFVNNAPSMTDQFSVIPLMASKRNPTIIGAEYKLDDSSQSVHGVWGFCDGKYVYVHYSSHYFEKLYWKIEYIGAYSFFSVKRNNVATMAGPIVTLAVDLDKFEYYDLIVIDRNGNFKAPTFKLMRKWLKDVPSLLKQFDAETIQDETRKTKDYLYDLSEALNHK